MFPIDPLWIYIVVPTVLIFILVLIRLRQEKMDKRVDNAITKEEEEEAQPPHEREVTSVGSVEIEKAQTEPKLSEDKGAQGCPHYLGYLYMKKGRDSTYIPNECYGCRKLLECLYSPTVIEKVYGE